MAKEQKYSKAFEDWYAKKRPFWCDEYCAKCGKRYLWAAWNAGKANGKDETPK